MSDFDQVLAARDKDRPTCMTLISRVFTDFMELHGDRRFGDDPAVVGGLARLRGRPVTVICTEKGRDTKERITRRFGSALPEGYRKALRLMKQAEKFGRPVITFVDTAGAFCGMEGEERGQGQAIAENLMEMSALKVPILAVITGEGGSGGALGLAVGNRVWMLEHSAYSVITPEGCASILWKDAKYKESAAEALSLTAPKLLDLGVIDKIIPEEGGDVQLLCARLEEELSAALEELSKLPPDALAAQRYDKFRGMGVTQLCSQS